MPAPIIRGLINYLSPLLATELGVGTFSVWDGEVPRFDAAGNAVGPQSTTGSWPAVDVRLMEPGMGRSHTMANSVKDVGRVLVRQWATTREACEDLQDLIEDAFEKQVSVYTEIDDVGGPASNPNYVFELTLKTYGCWPDSDHRTATSQLLYRGEMVFECKVHSSAPTTE
jgi:hypothetical protein